jgi:hypothetical protein
MDFNKKIALIAAGSLLSVGGLYAVSTSANAAETPSAPAITSPVAGAEAQDAADTDNVQEGNQNAANDATESGTESADDATESGTETADDATESATDTDNVQEGDQNAADNASEGLEVAGK